MNCYKHDKYHVMTTTYAEAVKFIRAGWTLKNLKRWELKGTNRIIEECELAWEQDGEPTIPDLPDPTPGV